MSVVEFLEKIRPDLISKASHLLARGESVRESFEDQLAGFFDLLHQAVVTGDPAWLNSILDQWAEARTQSEIEQHGASITPILNQILLAAYESARENLESAAGLELMGALLPIFASAFDYITGRETKLHVESIERELNLARVNAENLEKSKSDFISVAAHELKTPLTLIEGYSSMMIDQIPEKDHETTNFLLLKGMENGISRLRDIINDMIDVSLIDNDMLNLNFQPVWISRLLNIAEQELSEVIEDRRQIFSINEFEGFDVMTYGDPERLYQALRNILTNAIKYTPDGGSVFVDGRLLPGFVEITVQDTGIGIDEKNLEQIFQKFGRLGEVSLHSSGKTKFKGGGPGLGLPITKGLIEAHGGTIWAESQGYDEKNCPGSTFHILLPVYEESPDERMAKLFEPLGIKLSKPESTSDSAKPDESIPQSVYESVPIDEKVSGD